MQRSKTHRTAKKQRGEECASLRAAPEPSPWHPQCQPHCFPSNPSFQQLFSQGTHSRCLQEGLGSLASSLSEFEDGIPFPPPPAGCSEGMLGAEQRILARRPGIRELDLAIVAETGSWHPPCPPAAGCTGCSCWGPWGCSCWGPWGCSGWGHQRCSGPGSKGMLHFRAGDGEDASVPSRAGARGRMRPPEQQPWVWCEAKE